MKHLDFAFLVDVKYERLSPFCFFCKMIGHSDKSDQQVKFKQRYVPKSNLGIREEM